MRWIKRQFVDMFHFLHALWVPFVALVGVILFALGIFEMTASRYEMKRIQTEVQTQTGYHKLSEGETGMITGSSATFLIYSGGALMLYSFFAHKSHGERTKELERCDLERRMQKQAKAIQKREEKLQARIASSKRYREKILPTMAALTIALKHRSWEPVSVITHDVRDFISCLDENVEEQLGINHQKEVPRLDFDEPLEIPHEEDTHNVFLDEVTAKDHPHKPMRFMEHVYRDAKIKEKENT